MSFPISTPVRPVPGAFLPTPATSRVASSTAMDSTARRLFTNSDPSNSALAQTSASASTAAAGPVVSTNGVRSLDAPQQNLITSSSHNVDPITKAAVAIDQALQQDDSFPDLDSYCRRGGVSSDYDMPPPDSSWAPFHKTHMYPIPNQIFDHYNASRLQTLMGLFAEINHAWVVIDNSLFLWDYTLPEPELIGFEDQPHTIQAVALVAPKAGVFVNTITHVLAVATTTDMILLGVSATETGAGTKSVSLYQTSMVQPLRGVDVRVIAGTSDGRIFFGGNGDIDINELYYQQEERWFWNRCGKINHESPRWSSTVRILPQSVLALQQTFFASAAPEYLRDIVIDDTRNLVYTLSSQSTIRTYHMETPDKLTRVIEKPLNHCLRDITHMMNPSPLLTDQMSIVAISPISSREASKLHLMALTSSGCRLFLSATSSYTSAPGVSIAPRSMQVQFIKFPPPDRPMRVQASGEIAPDVSSRTLDLSVFGSRFAPGYFLDFVNREANSTEDMLFVSAPETGRIKNAYPATALKHFEHATWIDIGSKAEAIGLVSASFAAANQPLGFGNELAVQYDDPPSEFAVLTNTGVHIIRRRRLVDIFAASIRNAVGDEGVELEARRFINNYGRVETISTALAVACGLGSDARPGAIRAIDQQTQDRARTVFVDYGGNPTITETDASTLSIDAVKLSSRHDAVALYLARLVRTLWNTPVIGAVSGGGGGAGIGGIVVVSTVDTTKLVSIQNSLERLRKFLETNRGLIQGLSGPSDLQRASTRQEEVALQAEHQALHALQRLMESVSEGISFVLMLFDERVTDIYTRLDNDARQGLRELTYEKLFTQPDGKDLAKLLVKAIVNRNIESGSNVEAVADALRRRCGSFCSPDDVVIFKAQEQLKRASEQPFGTNLSRTLLQESLRLFEHVAGSLSFGNLQNAIEQYISLRYYAGAIQLCLVVAREKDRGNSALLWMRDGKPAGDPRGFAYDQRRTCYDFIHDVLAHLDQESVQEPEMVDGRLTLMATKRLEAYNVVNSSDDEVFHFGLYEWYIEQGWTDRILAIESTYVVMFLKQLSTTSAEHAELLYRYHTTHSQFFEAAKVQLQLANSDFAIGIQDRITLLSRAKANASVHSPGINRQDQQLLNHEVTELLEIAHIQDDLMERLQMDERLSDERREDIVNTLNGCVRDLSQLFNDFADQAGYYDLCLLIYHSADYRNANTIAGTWRNLIQGTHDDIMARRDAAGAGAAHDLPLPYELVTNKIQSIAHRTSLDSFVFPIQTLLPEVCRYAHSNEQDARIGADASWPVQLFLSLGVSHDMVLRVLETLLDTGDYGFSGHARSRVIEWIAHVGDAWLADVKRRGGGGPLGGSAGNRTSLLASNRNSLVGMGSLIGGGVGGGAAGGVFQPWVADLLTRCETALPGPGVGSNVGGMDLAELRRRVRTLRRDVQAVLERNAPGTLRF